MLLGVIADDFTGASDVANTLAKEGMRVTQFVGIPAGRAAPSCEAGVVSLKSRTIPASEAVKISLDACAWLQAQGASQILFKYCSTFDSTPDGNIGPVGEALLERLGGVAVVCPVFPATGRTLFNGHLFVGERLLSETGMRDHPLTPMSDPDIRRWLGRQTRGTVGLVPFGAVRGGPVAIQEGLKAQAAAGHRLIVVDAVGDTDLRAIGEAIAGHALVTGGSGIALGLPENFRKQNRLSAASSVFHGQSGPAAALSGSCSVQSLRQVAAYRAHHPALALEPDAVMDGTMTAADALAFARLHRDRAPLIFSSAAPEAVRAAQSRHGAAAIAARIEAMMGDIARGLADEGVRRLAIGGGETSGAVVKALGLSALTIGPEIDPGVPALAAEDRPLAIALKSGNFGADDFYEKAIHVLGGTMA